MTPIRFTVTGTPKAQPRARARVVCGHGGVYDPGTADDWKALVILAAQRNMPASPIDEPVMVDLVFRFARPKSHFGAGSRAGELKPSAPYWHTARPDRDNLDKCVLDALVSCGVLSDDCCVCDGRLRKRYAYFGQQPGCEVTITPAAGNNGETR